MIQHPFIDVCCPGNGVHPRPGKTFRRKLGQRGVQNPLLTLLWVPAGGLFSTLLSDFHANGAFRD
jgi:hypothetical protein